MEQKINNKQFSFLSKMVDACIEMFLKGSSIDECLKSIKALSEQYQNTLSQDVILDLLKQTENLFINYFHMLDEYNEINEMEKNSKIDINSLCIRYINLREGIIRLSNDMLSNYYFDLEKNIIRKLQSIAKKYNIYEEETNKLNRK